MGHRRDLDPRGAGVPLFLLFVVVEFFFFVCFFLCVSLFSFRSARALPRRAPGRYQGCAIPHAVQQLALGGRHLTGRLAGLPPPPPPPPPPDGEAGRGGVATGGPSGSSGSGTGVP